MYEMTFDEAKLTLKKLQEDKKQVLKGKARSFLTVPLIKIEHIFDFSMAQYKNFHQCAEKERKRAFDFFNDRITLAETGIFNTENFKKASKALETEDKIKKWTEIAQPKITEVIWDIEFEEQALIAYLRNFKE